MAGAVNFKMGDIYGYWGTTEETIPEADDQTALVDDQKAAAAVSEKTKNSVPIYLAIALIGVVALILGVMK